jgi:hypothetical protein
MGQGLEQPAPQTHPLAVFGSFFFMFLRVAVGFFYVAIDDFRMLQ